MAWGPISPELALVDPDLARARPRRPRRSGTRPRFAAHGASGRRPPLLHAPPRPYPFWARVTAALWLLVLGILIGGAAIPHARTAPRRPEADDAGICKAPA